MRYYFIIILILSVRLEAQVSIQGAGIQGAEIGGNSPGNGLLEVWDAAFGLDLWVTNVATWSGILNSGKYSTWSQFDTVKPDFTSSYQTNGFPAVVFNPKNNLATATRLRNNDLASLVSGPNGGKNFSLLMLMCSQTNGNISSFGLGNQSSSNNNASTFQLRSVASSITTTTMAYGWDTNSTAIASGVAGSVSTNSYMWIMFSSSNGTVNIMQNLTVAQASRDVTGSTMTLNTCTLGGLNRTNDNFVLPSYGAVTLIAWYTNWQQASTMTNSVNYFNSQYRKGIYRVFTIAGQP